MEAVKYSPHFYSTLKSWWEDQSSHVIPEECLSQTGVVIVDGEIPLLSGFLFTTNSKISWIEFIVANPKVHGEKRAEAFELLFAWTTDLATELGFKFIFADLRNPNLISRFEKSNYKLVSDNFKSYLRSL